MKSYRIGLDIGVGSVGYAVLENNKITEEPERILDLGVRTFESNEIPKTGESTAKERRENRGVRRRGRRKAHRRVRLAGMLKSCLGVDIGNDLKDLLNADVYALRVDALDRLVSSKELAKILLNIFNHRGFKSNRKSEEAKTEGALLKSLSANSELLKKYRTIGEAIYKDEKFKVNVAGKEFYNIRNHTGDYRNCFQRSEFVNELKLILGAQKSYGRTEINDDFIERVVEIFTSQRGFDEGPDQRQSPYKALFEVGKCPFEKTELRAPKASWTFEYFNALSKMNNLKINGEALTQEQISLLLPLIRSQKEIKFEKLRKLFNLNGNQFFNLCNYNVGSKGKKKGSDSSSQELSLEEKFQMAESKAFVSLSKSYEMRKIVGDENLDIIDDIAYILSMYKSDVRIDEQFSQNESINKLTDEQKSKLKAVSCSQFGSLSIKAMKKIIPYLEQGQRYDIACKSAGFNHSSFEHEKSIFLTGEKVEERLKDVTSNVARRSINQTLRIVNEIIKKYGSPQYISIELARDLTKKPSDRKKIEETQFASYQRNEDLKVRLQKEFGVMNPRGADLLKFRLYEEQDGKSMYSGQTIDIKRLFEPNYVQIDHILPISRSFDDSYNNKVLVIAGENQNKGNKTPFEYFGDDEQRWNSFKARVSATIKSSKKRNYFLKENFGEEQQQEFINRNLNDTQYMAKFLFDLFNDLLILEPSNVTKKQVKAVNGAATSYLRRMWGIQKIREDGDIHHAVDAAVIANVTESQKLKIAKYNMYVEQKFVKQGEDAFVNRSTGEVMNETEKQEFRQKQLEEYGKQNRLNPPYDEFVDELKIRSAIKYDTQDFSREEKDRLIKLGYTYDEAEKVKPVFISRMKRVKKTGPIHKDTIMSSKYYENTRMLVKTVPITSLKLDEKNGEDRPIKGDIYPDKSIENYHNKQDDRLLYLTLKNYMVEHGGKIAENVEIHKPRKNGEQGPLVKTVKVDEFCSNPVKLPRGMAENKSMYRVDFYKKKNKKEVYEFYVCPIYYSDVYAKNLPTKVVAIGKPWVERDGAFEFMFSAHKNDLIKIVGKDDIVLEKRLKNDKSNKPNRISAKEMLVYYNSTDISTASIEVVSHDGCYFKRGLGLKTSLVSLEKYYVDPMGKIYKAPKEEPKGL